jgi:protease-4
MYMKKLFGAAMLSIALCFAFTFNTDFLKSVFAAEDVSEAPFEYYTEDCNVAGIKLHGELRTYYDYDSQSIDDISTSEDIIFQLEEAEASPYIKTILLEIDSGGGSPVAAQELTDALEFAVTKPVVAQVREMSASAAYWVASAADHIIASPLSGVGSIGVTMSYTDYGKYNKKEGYTFNQISTGKFKDSGTPDKVLTKEEEAIFQRDVDIIFEHFKDTVEKNRGLSEEKVADLADGSTMLGQMALENGLIDQVGGYYDALDYIARAQNIEPAVCW